MDFTFSDDQNSIRELAYQIFTDRASDEFLLAFSRTSRISFRSRTVAPE